MRGRRAGAMTSGTAPLPVGHGGRMGTYMAGLVAFALTTVSMVGVSVAAPLAVEDGVVGDVLRTLDAPSSTESPTIHQTEEGFIRFLGAPPGGVFIVRDTGAKATGVDAAAQVFLGDHEKAFGVVSDSSNFRTTKVQEQRGASYVRLNQYYGDIPVFGAQVVVQMNETHGIKSLVSDIMRDTRALDDGSIGLTPTLTGSQALAAAIADFAAASTEHGIGDFSGVGEPALYVFRPSVLGMPGATHLVWKLRLSATGNAPVFSEVLIDAHSGVIALQYSLLEMALDRQIYDVNGGISLPAEPTRMEGDAPTGIAAVDDIYDFLGDTYNFFENEHDYDSYNDAGGTLVATVNVPFLNACWGCSLDPGSLDEGSGTVTEMLFGIGFEIDDVAAHELTHGVTQFTSGLIYFGDSGAINESFSDMWGEWVDQTNGRGDDSEENRWVFGEDLDPTTQLLLVGSTENPGFRNMKDPTIFGHPDRLGSPFRVNPNSFFDNGGVHINSGIGNKLCYLLTDGGSFNGQTVKAMGISGAADLFFGTQFLLPEGADYFDLFDALGAVANDLGLTFDERLNIANAAKAVEIVPTTLFETGLRDFRALSTTDTSGNPVIALSWKNPASGTFDEVSVVRSVSRFPSNFTDGEIIASGPISQFLDTEIVEGVTYYYSVIADLTTGLPQVVSARATAGETASSSLTESFGGSVFTLTGSNAVDLAYSQLVFTPVGGPTGPLGGSGGLGSFNNYEVTYHQDAFALPVPREDSAGRGLDITSPQGSGVILNLGEKSVPFFGHPFSQLYFSANGYISFQPIARGDTLNFPSLASHFAIPRISYFFAGTTGLGDTLASSAGGSMWFRELRDRLVITYEDVPQFNPFSPSTAGSTSTIQVELYFSGLIRFTYLDAVATSAVIGLSDGRGVPIDPADLFPNLVSAGGLADLSDFPEDNVLLRILPTASAFAPAGELVEFTVATAGPAGSDTVPTLSGVWNGPGGLRFGDNGDGTGTFSWATTIEDAGTYQMRVTAKADDQIAYQDISIQVGDIVLLPEATNLALITGELGEDPTIDRAVRTESALTAEYTYSHPYQTGTPGFYDEGGSLVYWYRNNQIVTSLTNRSRVSPQATRGGDRWYFGVVPVAVFGLSGPIAYSPIVTISAIPEIVSVTPAFGNVMGGDTVRIKGNRLGAPISVSFGGTLASSIAAISEEELEVVTPLHAPGSVSVVVRTANGSGILPGGFTYLGEGESVSVTDVNGDGKIDALDVQLVVNAVLATQQSKADGVNPDANRDGQVNSSDIQVVVNKALLR